MNEFKNVKNCFALYSNKKEIKILTSILAYGKNVFGNGPCTTLKNHQTSICFYQSTEPMRGLVS